MDHIAVWKQQRFSQEKKSSGEKFSARQIVKLKEMNRHELELGRSMLENNLIVITEIYLMLNPCETNTMLKPLLITCNSPSTISQSIYT